MLKRLMLAALAAAIMAGPASAQFASKFSWGPTVPMFKISLEDSLDGDRGEFLAAGAGVFFAGNLAPTADGRWRMVTFAMPVFVNYQDGFGLDAGLTIGTLNNLFSIGVAASLLKDGTAVGSVFTRENTYVLISASLNFGGGSPGLPADAAKLTSSGGSLYERPPGYVGW